MINYGGNTQEKGLTLEKSRYNLLEKLHSVT